MTRSNPRGSEADYSVEVEGQVATVGFVTVRARSAEEAVSIAEARLFDPEDGLDQEVYWDADVFADSQIRSVTRADKVKEG